MAIANADGSIVLSTKVDTSGVKKATNELRSEAMKLAAQYRKAGMTQSEAQKKAYRELGVTTKETEKATKATKKYGEQAKKSGGTAKSAFSSLGGALKKLAIAAAALAAAAAAFSVQKIIQFSSEASNLATNTEASVQRLIDIYGSASDSVGDFIDANARSLGMSKSAAASFSSVYGNLFSVWADQATNAELTNRYLQMTAVVASKTGRTVEDVQERIRSGLLGNTEAIEDLGIFVNVKTIEMTDAFQRMANGKSWEQLDAYTQQQVRTMAILEQATGKYGDQVSQTAVLAKSQFSAAYQDFQNTWGKAVNIVLIPILNVVTAIIQTATIGLQSLFGFSDKLLGNAENTTGEIAGAVENQDALTDSLKKTEKAQKGVLAGFDDIQILSSGAKEEENTTLGGSIDLGLSGSENQTINALEDFRKKFDEILAPIKESFVELFASGEYAYSSLHKNALQPLSRYFTEEFTPQMIDEFSKAFKDLSGNVEDLGNNIESMNFAPVFSELGGIILMYVSGFLTLINDIFSLFNNIPKDVFDVLSLVIAMLGGFLEACFGMFHGWLMSVSQVIVGSVTIIASILQAIGYLFAAFISLITGDFDGFIANLINAASSVVDVFIGLLNVVIGVINFVWTEIFAVVFAVVNPILEVIEFAGKLTGKNWKLDVNASKPPLIPMIPTIPKLAQGAVIPPNREFLAVLGDQTRGTNIEAPLQTIVDAFNLALAQNGGARGGKTEIVLEVSGREFGRAVVDLGSKESRRIGTRLAVSR